MFKFWKRRPQAPAKRAPGLLRLPSDFSDSELVGSIHKALEAQIDVARCLFLVAYDLFPVYYPAYRSMAARIDGSAGTPDDFIAMFSAPVAKAIIGDYEPEQQKRRIFYLYVATLLTVAEARAEERPELREPILRIWVLLLQSSHALRSTLDRTRLWTAEETTFYQDVKSPKDGEMYCLRLIKPQSLWEHPIIVDWLERDMTQEQRAQMRDIDKEIDDIFKTPADDAPSGKS